MGSAANRRRTHSPSRFCQPRFGLFALKIPSRSNSKQYRQLIAMILEITMLRYVLKKGEPPGIGWLHVW